MSQDKDKNDMTLPAKREAFLLPGIGFGFSFIWQKLQQTTREVYYPVRSASLELSREDKATYTFAHIAIYFDEDRELRNRVIVF